VSKTSFVRALEEKKAVLICPGGQVRALLWADKDEEQ